MDNQIFLSPRIIKETKALTTDPVLNTTVEVNTNNPRLFHITVNGTCLFLFRTSGKLLRRREIQRICLTSNHVSDGTAQTVNYDKNIPCQHQYILIYAGKYGNVKMSILTTNWSPALTIKSIFITFLGHLFHGPDLGHIANEDAANLWQNDKA